MVRLLRVNFAALLYVGLVVAAVLGPVHHSVFHVLAHGEADSHHTHHPHHDHDDDGHHDHAGENGVPAEHETDCCGFQLALDKVKTAGHDVTKITKAELPSVWTVSLLALSTSADSRAQLPARPATRPPDSPGDIARLRTILLLV